jgi:hypothetical protein
VTINKKKAPITNYRSQSRFLCFGLCRFAIYWAA